MFKNKKFGLLVVIVLLIVPMVLAACGEDEKKADGGGDGDAVKLDQSFEAVGISITYPDGWAAREDSGGIQVSNSEAAFAAMDAEAGGPREGQAAVAVLTVPLADMGGMGADEAFELMASSFAGEDEGTEAGAVKEIKVGDKDGFRTDISDEASNSEGFVIGFEVDGTMIIAVGVTSTGELGDFESTLLAITDTIEYSAPAAE